MSKYIFIIKGRIVADGIATIEAESLTEANAKFAVLEPELIEWEYDPADFHCGATVTGVSTDGAALEPMNWQANTAGFWFAEDVNKPRST